MYKRGKQMKEVVWLIHERKDKYEFPIFVADTSLEIAKKLGISVNAVNKRLRDNNQRQAKYIISRVEI